MCQFVLKGIEPRDLTEKNMVQEDPEKSPDPQIRKPGWQDGRGTTKKKKRFQDSGKENQK